ncbi:glycosyl transferase [Leuconostoc citreum]|uniref:Glycosyl transferase n=1 Tax=Leuconostoc citreum TaxID=33964 RepID=A0A5A5TZR6_LEUCI|nr:glycosyltransferase family 2 protein [Leuconostoc citreum]GDZ83286.1 glycosyl transferase [Leuconostoc citreum]
MKKKVSVLVAAYNVEKTISQTVQSILKQTYDNMEIIVVNDGSKDNTEEILKTFTDKVVVINKSNQGLGSSRNAGLEKATGDFIMFIDGDDYFAYQNVIEDLVNLSEKDNAELVVADFNYVDSSGKILSKKKVQSEIESMYSGAWNKLYAKNLWSTKRFPENILYEDSGIVMSVGISANKITVLHEPIYSYRQSEKTITQSLDSPERHLDSIKAFEPYIDMVNLLPDTQTKRSAVRYMNHILLGHAVVVKAEYLSSNQQVAVLKKLLYYMEIPLLKKGGFSSRFIPDKVQQITFKLLKTDKLQLLLDLLLGFAINIRNKKRNKRR